MLAIPKNSLLFRVISLSRLMIITPVNAVRRSNNFFLSKDSLKKMMLKSVAKMGHVYKRITALLMDVYVYPAK